EAPGASLVIQKKDWATTLRLAAKRCGEGLLWFDESSLTLDRVKLLRKHGLRLTGGKDPVAPLREVKDKIELGAIRLAIRRAEESFLRLKKMIRPGMTEREIALRLEYLIREKGSRRVAFDIIVASGRNGAMPHASVTGRRIKRGDLVTIDFGAEAHGYLCDITRTFCIGPPTARQRAVHALVLEAQQAAIERVLPGAECRALDFAARETITHAGYGKEFGHATGHGIGLMVHEGPSLSALSRDRAAEGMIFTIEPGVYLPGWGGVRIEDMVVVTKRGAKLLTSLSKEL
ncbi:MAG TPA: M24 family metallopeptidase, partial [Nitrospirota bacterium]|nr:M24 family metallopeptidase [Nitrospirota bacterium]